MEPSNNNSVAINESSLNPELSRKVFSNSLLLTELSKRLDSKSLLSARVICKLWSHMATKMSTRRSDIQCLPFTFSYQDEAYFNYSKGVKKWSLSSLNELLQVISENPDGQFLTRAFSFILGPLNTPDFIEFIQIQGQNIKELDLQLKFKGPESEPHDSSVINSLYHLFLVGAPNIQKLALITCGSSLNLVPNQGKILFKNNESLPNLKIISIRVGYGQEKIYTEILRAASNLQEVFSFNHDGLTAAEIEIVTDSNKVYAVRDFSLCVEESIGNIDKLETFVNSLGLELKSLAVTNQILEDHVLSLEDIQVADALSKLLKKTQKSLESLKISDGSESCPFYHFVTWPSLEQCTSLEFDGHHYSSAATARDSVQVVLNSQVLPNLKKLVLHSPYFPQFQDDFKMASVRYFQVKRQLLSGDWSDQIKRIFPNLDTLIVGEITDIQEHVENLWNFPKLKRLGLDLACGPIDSRPEHSFPFLDSAFTGLSRFVAEKLRDGESPEYKRRIQKLRSLFYMSILELKELEHLKIRFTRDTHYIGDTYDLLSAEVTGKFAFELMKNTRIEINTLLLNEDRNFEEWKQEMGEALQPMTPYAKLDLDSNCRYAPWFSL